jgi:CPA2 family monovalent cation:H+ antiporter-2
MRLDSLNTLLISVGALSGIVLLLMFLLKKLHQPYLIAYILTGVVIGPHGLGIFNDTHQIMIMGEIGILLHLFFLGTEIEIPDSRSELIKPIAIQILKMALCAIVTIGMSKTFHLDSKACVTIWCILIFNSTAVASEYLKKTETSFSILGKATLNSLVLQDLIFGPIILFLQFAENPLFDKIQIIVSSLGCIVVGWVLWIARNRQNISIPWFTRFEGDHDLQIFFGFAICAAFALISSKMGLTASFGGFVAGILISRISKLSWLEGTLRPFYIFFMCLFFLFMGLSLDIPFIQDQYKIILTFAVSIVIINSALSALALWILRYSLRDSLYGGALMSQIGEYSLLIASVAFQFGSISATLYKTILCTSVLSILFSTVWITLIRAFIFKEESFLRQAAHYVLKNKANTTNHQGR